MLGFIKSTLSSVYQHFTKKIGAFFYRETIDKDALKELETLLISGDVGVKTTHLIMQEIRANNVSNGLSLHQTLHTTLLKILKSLPVVSASHPSVIMLVGINGSGKTTCASKLAALYKNKGKKVLLVAADTFRAAAVEQLTEWADRVDIAIHTGTAGQDPAAVVFGGCERFQKEQFDILIVDTAGRLQTKVNLMNELSKIRRIIEKKLPDHTMEVLLTIDSMLGQNSFDQARLFKECTHVDGIALTKMDGTGKGGIVFAIASDLGIPVRYITFGEDIGSIKKFDAETYVDELLAKVE